MGFLTVPAALVNQILENGYESETITLLAALSGTYSTARQNAINDLIAGLKTNDIWSKLDQFWWCLDNILDTCVNWKSPGTFNLTNNGATLTANASLSFDGTNDHLATNFNSSTAGGNFSLDSATVGYWKVSGRGVISGKTASTAGIEFRNLTSVSNRRMINAGNASNANLTVNDNTLNLLTRSSSTGGVHYYNDTSLNLSQTSTALPNVSIIFGAENINGTIANYEAGVYQGGIIGGALTGTDVSNFRSLLAAFKSAY